MKFSIGTWETGSHVDLPIYVEANSIEEAAEKLGLKAGARPNNFYIPLRRGFYEVHLHKFEEIQAAEELKKTLLSGFGYIPFL